MSARSTRRPVHVEARDPDCPSMIFTRPDEDGTGFIAWRWGQAHLVGRGREEIDAVKDLCEQEERVKRGLKG